MLTDLSRSSIRALLGIERAAAIQCLDLRDRNRRRMDPWNPDRMSRMIFVHRRPLEDEFPRCRLEMGKERSASLASLPIMLSTDCPVWYVC
jgi:hypothetical protein